MRIAILDLCSPHPDFDRHGTVGELIRRWISPPLPEARIEIVNIAGGAALPRHEEHHGYILSGSELGVYDQAPWMDPLRDWIRKARPLGTPLFGICFGHQIMADAFGAGVAKADKGFVIGARDYETEAGPLRAHAMHQDQVLTPPQNARVTISAGYCPVAGLAYDFPARSVQFHPEYGPDFVNDGIKILADELLSGSDIEAGKASMEGPAVPRGLYAEEAAAFFREAIGAEVAAR